MQRAVMRRLIDRNATAVVGVSPSSLTAGYRARWAEDERCTVVPNGIPTTAGGKAFDVHTAFGIPETALVLMHVGRPSLEKNRARLPGIVAAVAAHRPAHLVLVGGQGPDAPALERAINRAGVTALVHHAGSLDDVMGALGSADVLVQPSTREGLPGAVLEGLAVGTPVVSSDVPGAVWIADRLPGLSTLPLPAEDERWAEVVLDAAATSDRRSLRDAFAASDFAFDVAVARHAALYGAA
jgi:glycosyltransferase involved in cell wall biosynthesis